MRTGCDRFGEVTKWRHVANMATSGKQRCTFSHPMQMHARWTKFPSHRSTRTRRYLLRRRNAGFPRPCDVARHLSLPRFLLHPSTAVLVGLSLVTKIRCVQRRPTRIFGVLVAPSVHQWERFPPVRARRASRLVHVRQARCRTKRALGCRCVVADERTCVRQLVVPVCRDGRGSRSRRGCCKCVVEDASSTCASRRTKEAL